MKTLIRKLAREAVIFMLAAFVLVTIGGWWSTYRSEKPNLPYDPGKLMTAVKPAHDGKSVVSLVPLEEPYWKFNFPKRCYEFGGRPLCNPPKIPWLEILGGGFFIGLFGFPAGLALWVFYRLVVFAIKG